MSHDAETLHEDSQPAQWEFDALAKLAERDLWSVDKLPDTVDAAVLRCLDERGWIEVRLSRTQNLKRYPGDDIPLKRSHGEWFSPSKRPDKPGDWDAIVSRHQSNHDCDPSQIRVGQAGKAALTRRQRDVSTLSPTNGVGKLRTKAEAIIEADRPDESGYVPRPTDLASFRPAVDILRNHSDRIEPHLTAKKLGVIVEDYSANRVRWTRPISPKTGEPMPQRRSIHLGDWQNYLDAMHPQQMGEDGLPTLSEDEIEERKSCIRSQRELGK